MRVNEIYDRPRKLRDDKDETGKTEHLSLSFRTHPAAPIEFQAVAVIYQRQTLLTICL